MARYESMNALVFLRICGNENVGPRNYHVSKENSTKLFGSDRRVYSAQEYIYLLHWNVQNRSLQLTCQSSRLSWIWSESAKPGQLWWRLPVSSLSIVVGPLNKNIVVGELNHCACYVTGNHSMYTGPKLWRLCFPNRVSLFSLLANSKHASGLRLSSCLSSVLPVPKMKIPSKAHFDPILMSSNIWHG